jgi:SNF2 family DNA or RNA helicase
MTATLIETPSEAPEGALYWSPRGLYPFQLEHIATALVMRTEGRPYGMFQWDTGLGKSHAAMALSAFTVEDQAADVIFLVCERVKLKEWRDDFNFYTSLQTRIHHGGNRKAQFAKKGWPQVVISTYETFKTDLVKFEANKGGRGKHAVNGWMMDELDRSGLRPMVIFDEADKLSHRTSATYKAWDHILRTLRKTWDALPVYMLTATSVRRTIEDSFNQFRLLAPKAMPQIQEFEKYFVRSRNIYGKAVYHDFRLPEFAALCQPLMYVKSKTDPDVRDQFPTMTEDAMWVDLEGGQRELYDMVRELNAPGCGMTLRQICAHPASLLHSAKYGDSALTKDLVAELGEDYFRALPSAKTERLIHYLKPIVLDQQDKAVVFSFFGPSVLPLLKEALEKARIPVWLYNDDDGAAWKRSHRGGVLLCSDAASRGINLPQASYLIEYDVHSTIGGRTQRLNRISRIGEGGPTATVKTMLARETVEIGLLWNMLGGNEQAETLLGRGNDGGEYITAEMRKELLTKGMKA